MSHLEKGERVEADDGYQHLDPEFVRSKSGIFHPPDPDGLRNTVMARQESVNRRMKNFAILRNTFHHDASKHQIAFFTAAVLVQMSLNCEDERLFDVEYEG